MLAEVALDVVASAEVAFAAVAFRAAALAAVAVRAVAFAADMFVEVAFADSRVVAGLGQFVNSSDHIPDVLPSRRFAGSANSARLAPPTRVPDTN